MPPSPSGSFARRRPSDGVCRRRRLPPRSRRAAPRRFLRRIAAPREVSRYLSSLHLEDLALACACALGDSAAWDHFVLEMRPGLYRAADALDRSGDARESSPTRCTPISTGSTSAAARASRCCATFTAAAAWPRGCAPCSRSAMSTACASIAAPSRCRRSWPAARRPQPPTPTACASSRCCVRRSRSPWRGSSRAIGCAFGCYYAQQLTLAQDRRVAERARGHHVAAACAHAKDHP